MPIYEIYSHAGEVDYASWKEKGIIVPIFDKDGTLTHVNSQEFAPEVITGLKNNLVNVYSVLAINSNNHNSKEVQSACRSLEEELGIYVFGLCRADGFPPKPDPAMGQQIAKKFGIQPNQIGVVGDRRFTDVGFGKRLGAGAIALCHKVGEGDAAWVPTLRKIEKRVTGVERLLGKAA